MSSIVFKPFEFYILVACASYYIHLFICNPDKILEKIGLAAKSCNAIRLPAVLKLNFSRISVFAALGDRL